MLPSETLWPTTRPPAFERVGSTQPFNYRDTLSLLDYVNQIVAHIQSVQSDVNGDMGIINGDVQTMQDTLAAMLLDMANLRDELIGMIKQAGASDNVMAFSPAYGSRVPVQSALDDTYDANRIFGLFAGDFDNLTMSPADFDALEISPRAFDLHSTNVINAVRGDITSNNIWWYNKVGDTVEDPVKTAQQGAASAASSSMSARQSAANAEASSVSAAKSAASATTSSTSAAQSAQAATTSQKTAQDNATTAVSAAGQATSAATSAQQASTTATTAVAKMPTILTAANESAAQTLSSGNPDAWVFYPEAA